MVPVDTITGGNREDLELALPLPPKLTLASLFGCHKANVGDKLFDQRKVWIPHIQEYLEAVLVPTPR